MQDILVQGKEIVVALILQYRLATQRLQALQKQALLPNMNIHIL